MPSVGQREAKPNETNNQQITPSIWEALSPGMKKKLHDTERLAFVSIISSDIYIPFRFFILRPFKRKNVFFKVKKYYFRLKPYGF